METHPVKNFCTITCDRGDRKALFDHCKWQLSRMTMKPAKSYFIDYPPKSPEKDLVERFRYGVTLAKEEGFDFCYVIESDDYYPANYFERMTKVETDFTGDPMTCYYSLKNNGYHQQYHRDRASLFTTGFRISALDKFDWSRLKPDNVFLDIVLWQWAKSRRLKTKFIDSGAVGMKHGIGLTGGIGHRQKFHMFDPDWSFLSNKVDAESLEFYKSLHEKIK